LTSVTARIIKTTTTTIMMICRMPAMSSITPAAVNLHGPSSTFFGAQHMSMLEAMQASNPLIAPTMPGMPPMKPTSEKMELPHTGKVLDQQCSRHS
jgi:hypothetical protein